MMADDNTQHAGAIISDDDSETGAAWGGLGGAVVGATAGSVTGPVGSVVGAVVGGLAGAGLSGVVVSALDRQQHESGAASGADDATSLAEAGDSDNGEPDEQDGIAAEADVLDARYNAHHSIDNAVFAALHGRDVGADEEPESGPGADPDVGGIGVGLPDRNDDENILPPAGGPEAEDPLGPGGATRDRNETEPERIDNTTY